MIPLSRDGAHYFCSGFSGSTTNPPEMRNLYSSRLDPKRGFKEGEPEYALYRDALLRDSDRSFFLGIACFRRALALFTPATIFWAHVSLYYAGFFAAHSILGMFGCWVVGRRGRDRIVVEADYTTPGSISFRVNKSYRSTQLGSHQYFWDAYYEAVKTAIPWTDATLELAVSPITRSRLWSIEHRNMVNYETNRAFKLMEDHTPLDTTTFPGCLKGAIVTQFNLSRALLVFCAERATEFNLNTDVHVSFPSRADAIRDLIYRTAAPDLLTHAEETNLAV